RIADRVAIVVDDGIATGVTTRAAVRSVRIQGPKRLILATPVCAMETAEVLRQETDELVSLLIPREFYAVGLWYRDFTQTTDEEILDLLTCADTHNRGPAADA